MSTDKSLHSPQTIKPVFICGHPKAGTSLVRALLDYHPELIVYPEETLFFRRYLLAADGKTAEEKIRLAEELLIHIFEWNVETPPVHQAGYPDRDYKKTILFDDVKQKLHARLENKDFRDGDILEAALLAYGETQQLLTPNVKWWVEKSPYNEWFIDQIIAWWPDAKFIHVVRDPRDNYTSYHRKHTNWDTLFFAKNWKNSTRSGLINKQKIIDPTNYWVLNFEDLVAKPEEVIHQLTSYLGISDEPILHEPTRNGEAWYGNSMFSEQFEEVSQKPIGRWEKYLTIEEIYTIQKYCEDEMRTLGYELKEIKKSSIPLRLRLRLVFEKTKFVLKSLL